jgi:predicted Holliday junction resolvase-like endonuclease
MNSLVQTIDGLQEILGICPCCGEIFRLVEAKFTFPQRRPRSCEYLDLLALERRAGIEQQRIEDAECRFEEKLESQRESLKEQAKALVKKKMRRIDPTFTGRNINPQDVKAIFHPVEYVVFHGLCADDHVETVRLVSRTPQSKPEQILTESLESTIVKGYVEFETLRLDEDGSFLVHKE